MQMNKHLKRAATKAQASTFDRARIGAVIVKGGRILVTGHNEIRYSKRTGKTWPSIHAEEKVILTLLKQPGGLKQLAGATIYVSRVLKNGETALAKPCKMCSNLIQAVGIKRVIHT